MSKSSTASAPKLSSPLPSRSAWLKGPPQNTSSAPTPRTQSPAPPITPTSATAPSHSRRPSTLQQGVIFKDGVGARSPVGAPKSASVTFGSIDDASAPLSSSPASVPPIKPEVPKTFGSVTAQSTILPAVNGKPSPSQSASTSVSASAKPSTSTAKLDVKKLFQGGGPSLQPSSDPVPSPSTRPAPLPQHSSSPPQPSTSHTPQSSQFGSHSFQTFVPGSGLRPTPNGTNASGPPRSPVYPRQQPNGAAPPANVNGRPQGAPGTSPAPSTPMSAGMPSPRMGPPHPGQPPAMPPGQPVAWNPYYYGYPGMPPEYMYAPQWQMHPHVVPPPHQAPHTPGGQPPHQPPHQHQQSGMPMSPRHPPSSLHPPGTPTVTPAVPVPAASPHIQSVNLSSVTSPPSTPSSASGPGAASAHMNQNAKPFVPSARRITIKNSSGVEVDIESIKKGHAPSGSVSGVQSPVSAVPGSPARKAVRIETEEAKLKRLADEEKAKKEKEDQERRKREAEEKAKREEEERIQREKEEAERIQREKEEEERRKKEEVEKERLRKEEQERERIQKEEEEKERLRKEAEEKVRKEAEEKVRKEAEEKVRKEAEEKVRKEREEAERRQKEEEERAKREAEEQERARIEAEEKAAAEAQAAKKAEAAPEPEPAEPKSQEVEEGELEEQDQKDDAEARDKVPEKPPLRLDTTLDKKRPGPLDLSGTKGPIQSALPSALATARIIEDISEISYPEGIMSPKVELNMNAKQGKFRYDRDFLLQFMAVCKEKPDSLPPLDAIGLEPSDQHFTMSRGGSGRRQPSISGMPPPSSTARPGGGVGLGISGFKQSGFTMGQFATPGGKMSSEERFAMANRSTSMSSGPAGMPFGRPSPMVRSSSQGGPGAVPMGNKRTRSKRGENRNANAAPSQPSAFGNSAAAQLANFEPVAPLEFSANRWTPQSMGRKGAGDDESPEVVERKVKGLLNKLTMEKFDSISDQIIAWANRSEKEKDGRTLIQVIKLVFEKATDEATWSEMYARLCRKMMEQISPKVQDDGIRNAEGKHITGGHLFRKYLLNRCQEDFERGWASKESTAAAAASKAGEDEAAKAAAENSGDGEVALYSEEYYAAQKAKRQGLGLIKFIGELFKLQMLTERIMHECVKKLLGNVENPEEEEIESLCRLLTTVGALLDTPKARAHMDVYFSRMKELTKSQNVTSRMQFMLQDILELRERKWIPRNQAAAPTTLAAVHELAAKEKANVEKEQYQRTLSMSRGGSRRGGERGEPQVGPDGWAVAGGSTRSVPPKAGDLSNFGKISKPATMTFGPSSVFAGKKEGKRDSTPIPRQGSANMFSMLGNSEISVEGPPASKGSRPPSRKPSIDLGSGGAPEVAPQRRKLNLLPRTVSKPDDTPAGSTVPSEDEGGDAAPSQMSDEEVKARIAEDTKEFFSIRDLEEAEVYFTKLPVEHRHKLVDKLVSFALESKESDVTLVSDLFARAVAKNLASPATFEQGFEGTAEFLDDIAVDAPKAPQYFVAMMKGAGLDKDEERCTRLLGKSMDSEKLLGMLAPAS
ncbi:uncharacterized protein PHACADRAFT_259721 [Phanerochaete carnosa HHB-10118-sp]|uniref:MI domain-containing protein n=1 Tax=Phanerochaete carnosa (strain HHB-10118-sp) TaxID=650164 RepID=K5W2P6_PHACS|nr:uncharacterized protein PHACADRAFT_259721 [Phanerochaete carnosa HHB-10118-sp]EKM53380.1 hypothetical protein PHACADRAFT_259721 [Phanerochaete carnosa HHB-10118-sp]